MMMQLQCCPQQCVRENKEGIGEAQLLKAVRGIGFGVADKIKINLALNSIPENEIGRRFAGILIAAGVETSEANKISFAVARDIANSSVDGLPAVGVTWRIDTVLMQRNLWVAEKIAERLLSGSAIDHDSGDSYVASEIQRRRTDVTVETCDSHDFRREVRDLPFTSYDYATKAVPFEDGQFDNAIMATVLHHCDEPERMFNEVMRTVRRGGRLIILENTFKQGDTDEQQLNVIFDWIFNSIIHETVLPLPFSHFCTEEWEYFFASKGLRLLEKLEMGQHPSIPLSHVLYVVEKQ